jgi:hypothetical protein
LKRLGTALVSTDSYGLALVLLACTYVISVSAQATSGASAVVFVQIAVVFFVLHTSGAHRTVRLFATVVMVVAGLAALAQLIAGHGDSRPHALIPLISCALYLTALFAIVRNVATRDAIDLQSALGVVAAYLCIGFFFAFAYRAVSLAQAGPFFGRQGDGSMSNDMFFSMTTLTTTGYGNLVPAANPGQSLAVVEMMTGQLFLIVVVGKVIAALPGRHARETAAASDAR